VGCDNASISETPTPAQLKNGASGIAYRAEQLTDIVLLYRHEPPLRVSDDLVLVLSRAFTESALVNARGFARFFLKHGSKGEVNGALYGSEGPSSDLRGIARKVEKAVQAHLGHPTKGAETGEPHPGTWPVMEVAVILVGGLSEFWQRLTRTPDIEPAWFTPSPVETYNRLMQCNPLVELPTVADSSNNKLVLALTTAARSYLSGHGLLTSPSI